MTSTVITALFDIGRDKDCGDGRSINQYKQWFDKTLSLNVPMVIYTEKQFEKFIWERRKKDNTKVVIQKLNKIPYYSYKDKLDSVLSDPSYKANIMDPHRIECNLSLYNIIQYSKFDWILEAIEEEYFDTDYYFWMDAGCSRFFQDVDTTIEWPKNYNILSKDKFNIQGNRNTNTYKVNDWNQYIWDCNSMLVGTLFGGRKDVCQNMARLVKQLFEYYLNNNITNNEQIILQLLHKQHPDFFNVYIELDGNHLPLFKKLAS
jgi:hypothetical protein